MTKYRSRKQTRSRKQRKSRRQRGGASCAAQPMARSNFQQQGGFADWNGPTMLLDRSAQIQAESFDQVAAIDTATAMAKAQVGGRRRSGRRSGRRGSYRKHGSRSRKHKGSRKGRKHYRRRSQRGGAATSPSQRGGEAPMDWSLNLQGNQGIFDEALAVSGRKAGLGAQPFLAKA
jgi:hypothetical protein